MNRLAKILGKTVAKDADYSHSDLKRYISVGNIKNIIQKHIRKDKSGRTVISSNGISDSMGEIFDWLTSREIASLAAQDKIDCFWDSEKNQMMFQNKSK